MQLHIKLVLSPGVEAQNLFAHLGKYHPLVKYQLVQFRAHLRLAFLARLECGKREDILVFDWAIHLRIRLFLLQLDLSGILT